MVPFIAIISITRGIISSSLRVDPLIPYVSPILHPIDVRDQPLEP